MAKKTKSVQTKVLPVPFIDLKSMGVIRDGKARVAFGYGRIAAKPEYPISSLAIPMSWLRHSDGDGVQGP